MGIEGISFWQVFIAFIFLLFVFLIARVLWRLGTRLGDREK